MRIGNGDVKMAWGCEGYEGLKRGCGGAEKIHLLRRIIHWQSGANRKVNVRLAHKKGDASDR